MAKSNKLIVQDLEIALTKVNDEDYICVTDMIKAKNGKINLKVIKDIIA